MSTAAADVVYAILAGLGAAVYVLARAVLRNRDRLVRLEEQLRSLIRRNGR